MFGRWRCSHTRCNSSALDKAMAAAMLYRRVRLAPQAEVQHYHETIHGGGHQESIAAVRELRSRWKSDGERAREIVRQRRERARERARERERVTSVSKGPSPWLALLTTYSNSGVVHCVSLRSLPRNRCADSHVARAFGANSLYVGGGQVRGALNELPSVDRSRYTP